MAPKNGITLTLSNITREANSNEFLTYTISSFPKFGKYGNLSKTG